MKRRGKDGMGSWGATGSMALLSLVFAATLWAQSTGSNAHVAPGQPAAARSAQYEQVQSRLARGWNTWDVNSVTTHVLLPQGLALHVGLRHNSTEGGDAFLSDILIGRLNPGAEAVTPGPHAWNGSYTDLSVAWKGHAWRVQSGHDGDDLVLLIEPLPTHEKPVSVLAPSVVISADFLWNRPGTVARKPGVMEASTERKDVFIFCTCEAQSSQDVPLPGAAPVIGPYFATDLTGPVGVSTGKRRSLAEIESAIARQQSAYDRDIAASGKSGPILDAIETTLGWDTIYEPEKQRVVSPVSRVWSVNWGGYVVFDWDTFFAATMAGIGDKNLAYADALETLREETQQGFVPNYARAGNWKSADRSEPPVGAITVLGLYQRFRERWFLQDAFEPLLRWNRWWHEHRTLQGFIVLGSDPENQPANLDDDSRGTWQGAVFESGLDNSPMYDGTFFNSQSHKLEYADVGMTSLYVADCDALAEIARTLGKAAEAEELSRRAQDYRTKLATLWSDQAGIFLNRDLHTDQPNLRLSPTNFYPLLAGAATPEQARTMIEKHLKNPAEFWGEFVIPSIARNDAAFHDQNYWRGRIWGPMNYLVYLGLQNSGDRAVRREFAEKSYALFLKEWKEHGHVHENYNAVTGTGDDVSSSDRFYHWGALLGYVEYLEEHPLAAAGAVR